MAITGERECTWRIGSTASWIVLERSGGQGAETVPFRVVANGTPTSRRGNLAVESTQLELIQDGAPCTYELDHSRIDVDAGGGVASIRVTAMAGCEWSARAHDSWISVSSGGPVTGTGVVQLTVVANSGPAREGAATIAAHTIPVVQKGLGSPPPSQGPAPPPSPPSPAPPPPSPAPPPPSPAPPAPPPDDQLELEGRVSSLRGACPTLSFVVSGVTVDTDGSTKYRGGNCKQVDDGHPIGVTGRRQPNGRVRAEQVDLKP